MLTLVFLFVSSGFFKIIRGNNSYNLRIEEDCSFPVIDHAHYVKHFHHEPGEDMRKGDTKRLLPLL